MPRFACKFKRVDNKRVVTVSFIAKNEDEAKEKLFKHLSKVKVVGIKQLKMP